MKKLVLITITVISVNVYKAQNIRVLFSSKHFEIGKEDQNELKTEFTDSDYIYGLAIINGAVPPSERCDGYAWQESKSSKISYGTGVNSVYDSRLFVKNGKTYIFFDILPEPQHAVSRDVKTWSEYLQKTPAGGKTKFSIIDLNGNTCYPFTFKVKKASFTFSRNSGETNEQLKVRLRAIYDSLDMEKVDSDRENSDKNLQAKNEEDKKTGKLPVEYYQSDKWKSQVLFSSITNEHFIEVIKKENDLFEEGDIIMVLGNEFATSTYYPNGRDINYTTHNFDIIGKDKEGNCWYLKMEAYEYMINGSYTEPSLKAKSSKRYFNCENMPK